MAFGDNFDCSVNHFDGGLIALDPILGVGEEMLVERRAMLTMMTVWEWCSAHEITKNLARPEVARYVIRMTMELADLLGITLEKAQYG